MFESLLNQEGSSRHKLPFIQADFSINPIAFLETIDFGVKTPRSISQMEGCADPEQDQSSAVELPGLWDQVKGPANSPSMFESLVFTNPYGFEARAGVDTTCSAPRCSGSSKEIAPQKQIKQIDRSSQFTPKEARSEEIRVSDAVAKTKPDFLKEFLFKNLTYSSPQKAALNLIAGFTHEFGGSLRRAIKNGKLDKETTTAYEELLNNPDRMMKAAGVMLRRQTYAVIDKDLKSGKLSEADAIKMIKAIDHGSLPGRAIKMLIADERSQGKFGIVSQAIYSAILDTIQQDTSANVFAALLGSKRLLRTGSIPYLTVIGEGTLGVVSMPGSESYSLAFGEKLEYVERSTNQAPTEDQLKKVGALIETNKSLVVKKDDSLSQYQEVLGHRIANLSHRDLYQSFKTELQMRHQKPWQGGGLWAKTQDESVLTAIVEGSLVRQVKAGKLSEVDKEKQLNDLKNEHVIRPGTAIELLRWEAKLNVGGIVTDAIARCFQNDINRRIVNINKRLTRENADSKATIEPLRIAADSDDKSKPVDKISLCRQIELTEGKILSSEKYRNSRLESLQTMLSARASTLDPQTTFAHCFQNSLAKVQDRLSKGQLPPAIQKELSELNEYSQKYRQNDGLRQLSDSDLKNFYRNEIANKDRFDKILRQLAGEDLDKVLRNAIDQLADRGVVSANTANALRNAVAQRQIPNQLLKHLLSEERKDNSFGIATRATYATVIDQLDKEIPVNLDSLRRSGLTIPDGSPIKAPLSKSGRPDQEKLSEELNEWLDKKRYRGIPTKILDIDRNVVPSNNDLKKLFEASTWNEEARKILIDNRLDLMVRGLEKEVKSLGKEKEWVRRPGESIDAWVSKVAPMIDLAREVRSTYQALILAEKMTKNKVRNPALVAESEGGTFPGKCSFDKDGYPSRFALNLPDSLDASRENGLSIESITSWLRTNKDAGSQAMRELAEDALDDSRILIVGDIPGEGKLRAGDEAKDFNLSEHRVKVENIVVGGQKRIRIRNTVEYFHSRVYNVWNIGDESVGSRQCLTLAGDKEMYTAFQQAGIPADKAQQLIGTIKVSDIKLTDQEHLNRREARLVDTKYDARRLATIRLLQENKIENPEELADQIYRNYRDYKPNDLVCIADGDKTILIKAKDVNSWQRSERTGQLLGDGVSRVFDVGMVVIGVAELRAAGFGAGQLAKLEASALVKEESAIALRQSLATAIRTHRWHAYKSLALGVSGPLVSNPEVISTDWGKRLHSLRDTAIMFDLLSPLGKGYWRLCRGPVKSAEALKVPTTALSPEAIAINAKLTGIMEEMEKAAMPNSKQQPLKSILMSGTHKAMKVAEATMGIQLVNEILRKLADDHRQEPGLQKGGILLSRMQGGGDNASRFLATTSDALVSGDKELKARLLHGVSQAFLDPQNPDRRASCVQDLINDYWNCKSSDQSRKVAIAIGLLMMSQGPNGSFPEPIGWHKMVTYEPERGKRYSRKLIRHENFTKVHADDLMSEIYRFHVNSTPEQKIAVADALVFLGKLNLPQYATMCKQLLSDENSPKGVKIHVLLNLASCIEVQNGKAPGDNLVSDLIANFRCTPAELEASIKETARTSKDPDVQAMATGVYHALRQENRTERRTLLAKLETEWQAIKLTAEIQRLKSKAPLLKEHDQTKEEIAVKEKLLDKTLRTLFLLNNPKLQIRIWSDLQKKIAENESLALKASVARCELEEMQAKFVTLPFGSTDRIELENKIKAITKTTDQAEKKLLSVRNEHRDILIPKEQLPASLRESLADRLKSELSQRRPPLCKRTDWAARNLITIDGITMLSGEQQDPELIKSLQTALVELVHPDNGEHAIAALDRLLKYEQSPKQLRDELQSWLKIFLIYSSEASGDDHRAIVRGQVELLGRSKALIESGLLEESSGLKLPFGNAGFVKQIASLLAQNPDAAQGQIAGIYAERYPELRLAAAQALGTLKNFFSTLPVDQKTAILKVLYETMKPVSKAELVETQSVGLPKRKDFVIGVKRQYTEPVGEPQAEVRRKAFESAKILSDCDPVFHREFIEKVRRYSDSERDLVLSREYGAVLRNTPVSEKTESDRQLYDSQVDYWKSPRHGISNHAARQLLSNRFEYLDPDKFKRNYDAALDKYRNTQFDFKVWPTSWRGHMGTDSREKADEAKKVLDHLVLQRKHQFAELVRLAAQPGHDQHKACLIWLATSNYAPYNSPTPLDAAKEIRRIVKEGAPDRALFYDGIMEAFAHENTPNCHEVRLEFIGMLGDLLSEAKNKNPQSSKEFLGRLAYRALQLELDRPLSKTDNPQAILEQETRLLKLLAVVGKCHYVLAVPAIDVLKERQTFEDVSDTVNDAREAVTSQAKFLYLRLHDGISLDYYGYGDVPWHFADHAMGIDYMKFRQLNRPLSNSDKVQQLHGSRSNLKLTPQSFAYDYPKTDYIAARQKARLQEANYWRMLIDRSAISETRALDRLHAHYQNLDPQVYGKKYNELFRRAYDTKVVSTTRGSLLGKVGGGVSNTDANHAVRKLNKLRDSRQVQFGKLKENAARPGCDLDKACLLWLATSNVGPYSVPSQLDAARAVRTIATATMPDDEKALCFAGIIQAFKHDNLPCFHEVCMEFVGMLGDQLCNGSKSGISKSKQLVGMLASRALQLEMERKQDQSDTPENLIKRETRLFALIRLLDQCDYSSALLQLDALRQRPSIWDAPSINQSMDCVNRAAGNLYSRLKQSALPDRQTTSCDSLWRVVKARQKALSHADLPKQVGQNGDLRNYPDNTETKNVINNVCKNPIVQPNDPRIPLLEALLDDNDQGIALSAAWQLIRWADPVVTSDKDIRAIMRSQPFFALALRRLDEIADLKPANDRDANPSKLAIREALADTINDAREFRKLFKRWNWNHTIGPSFAR